MKCTILKTVQIGYSGFIFAHLTRSYLSMEYNPKIYVYCDQVLISHLTFYTISKVKNTAYIIYGFINEVILCRDSASCFI